MMSLFRKRAPETEEQIKARVRDRWCPSSAPNDPEFLRIVAREIGKAKARGRLVEENPSDRR